jgi:hypothetical protein
LFLTSFLTFPLTRPPLDGPGFGGKSNNMKNDIFHIVRAEKAGVFLAKIASIEGETYKLTNLRRLYFWSGALDVTMIAKEGIKNPGRCKFSVQLGDNDISTIHNVVEAHPVSEAALATLNSVAPWKQ